LVILDIAIVLLRFIAGMRYKEEGTGSTHTQKKEMLEWEKVNAVEYVRKVNIAEKEKLDNRVIVIEDTSVFVRYVLLLHQYVYT